jgi:hypothetical protein
VLKSFCHSNSSIFKYFEELTKESLIKMEKACKICCQPDYFRTFVWGGMIHPEKYVLLKNSRLNAAAVIAQSFIL